jgi:hypothetical protein
MKHWKRFLLLIHVHINRRLIKLEHTVLLQDSMGDSMFHHFHKHCTWQFRKPAELRGQISYEILSRRILDIGKISKGIGARRRRTRDKRVNKMFHNNFNANESVFNNGTCYKNLTVSAYDLNIQLRPTPYCTASALSGPVYVGIT